MICKNLTIPRKTTKIFELTFKRGNYYQDITGWTFYFIAKENMDDPDTGASIYKEITTHINPTKGKTIIELESVDTDIYCKNYHYSIDYLDDTGNEGVLFWGYLKIAKRLKD